MSASKCICGRRLRGRGVRCAACEGAALKAMLERFVQRNRTSKNVSNSFKRRHDDFFAQRERWIADLAHATPEAAAILRVGISALTSFISTINEHLPLLQNSDSSPSVSTSTGLGKLGPTEPQRAHPVGPSPAGRGASGAAGELIES